MEIVFWLPRLVLLVSPRLWSGSLEIVLNLSLAVGEGLQLGANGEIVEM